MVLVFFTAEGKGFNSCTEKPLYNGSLPTTLGTGPSLHDTSALCVSDLKAH